jgi:hypothetical protein
MRFRSKRNAQLRYFKSKLRIRRTDVVQLAIVKLYEAERRRAMM